MAGCGPALTICLLHDYVFDTDEVRTYREDRQEERKSLKLSNRIETKTSKIAYIEPVAPALRQIPEARNFEILKPGGHRRLV